MLSNEIGMEIDKVRINDYKLDSYITTEKKLESRLKDISSKVIDAYSSSNSNTLNSNNQSIVESTHIKIRNLNSYKLYMEKYMEKYHKTGLSSEDITVNLNNEIKKQDLERL